MYGRRIRASAPQSRQRVKNDSTASRSVTFNDDDSEIPTTSSVKHAGVYIPPTIQKDGMTTSNRIFETESPAAAGTPTSTSIKYWPQPNSNHHPVAVDQQLLETNDSKERNKKAISAAKKKILQLKKDNGVLHGRHSTYDRPVNRRPRGRGLHYSESSEDERYNPEYREMDEVQVRLEQPIDFATSASVSYLKSQSTIESQSLGDDIGSPSTFAESIDNRSKKSHVNKNDRFGYLTKSISEAGTFETMQDGIYNVQSDGGDSFFKTNQTPPFCTIAITAIQILITMLQFTMCGFASLDVNPTIGPFPDAFSEWGGKNPYLMLNDNEWWRLITPAFLHVGLLHLLVNIYCHVNAGRMFEKDWGWSTWLFVYVASEIGCSTFSNFFDPDTIAVGSTGAIMGLFAAKLSQVVLYSLFETKRDEDAIRIDQLSSVLCGLTMASLLGALTYIDFSGNLGGLVSGFFAGLVVFSSSIQGCCTSFFWTVIGLSGLIASVVVPMYFFILDVEPDEQLADVCQYFRSFFPEGYECGCLWN